MKAAEAKAWTVNVAGARTRDGCEQCRLRDFTRTTWRSTVWSPSVEQSESCDATGVSGPGPFERSRSIDREVVARFLDDYVAFAGDPFFADSALAQFVRTTTIRRSHEWTVAFVPGNGEPAHPRQTRLTFSRAQRGVGATAPVADQREAGDRSAESQVPAPDVAGSNDVARSRDAWGTASRRSPRSTPSLSSPVTAWSTRRQVKAKEVEHQWPPDKWPQPCSRQRRWSGVPITASQGRDPRRDPATREPR